MSRNDPRAPRLPDPRANPFAKARHALRMTQADFCRYIGVSLRSGAGFERGERTPPRHLALLCEYIVRYGPLQLPGEGGAEARERVEAGEPQGEIAAGAYRSPPETGGDRERAPDEAGEPVGHRAAES